MLGEVDRYRFSGVVARWVSPVRLIIERQGQKMLNELLKYCSENGRIFPMPMRWKDLYDMLPNTRQIGAGWEPPLPLILAAWYEPALLKVIRFQEHLQWANKHGALEQMDRFLRGLPEEEWFHVNDQLREI